MHKIMVGKIKNSEYIDNWEIMAGCRGKARVDLINSSVYDPWGVSTIEVVTDSPIAGTLLGDPESLLLKNKLIELLKDEWMVRIPKFEVSYENGYCEVTAMFYASWGLGGDPEDDMELALPDVTKQVDFFFTNEEMYNPSVLSEYCEVFQV